MGQVELARDLRLDRDVAVKTSTHHDGGARLEREARITARLQHPNIVPVLHAGVGPDGRPFYTMPVLPGRSLADALYEPGDRLRLVRHVLGAAWALAYAHDHGVVHRDLTPANILIGSLGETRVADWGLACTLDEPGEAVGTHGFMAPEQARGAAPHPSADVYSLGRVLEHVLNPGPPELRAIADRATAPLPHRYADARELALDVEAWMEGRRVGAHDYSSGELLVRFVQAWRAPLGVASLAALALAGAVAWGWTSTLAERDRALAAEAASDRNLGLALSAQARATQGSGPEGCILAAHALARTEDPAARGVIARCAGRQWPGLSEHGALPDCTVAALGPSGRTLGCVQPDQVSRIDLQGGPTVALAGQWDELAWVGSGDRALLLEPQGRVMVWQVGHDPVPAGTIESDELRQSQGPRGCYVGRGGVACVGPSDAVDLPNPCEPASTMELRSGPRTELVGCDDGRVMLGVTDPIPLDRFDDGDGRPSAVAWASDGSERAAVGTLRGQVRVYQDGVQVAHVQGERRAVRQLALDGDRLAIELVNGDIQVVDLPTGRTVARLSGDRDQLALRGDTLTLAGATLRRVQLPPVDHPHVHTFDEGVSSLSVQDGQLAVALGSGAIHWLSLETGRERGRWQWTERVAKDVAWSPDGMQLAAAVVGA
jgi:hypothetical protein